MSYTWGGLRPGKPASMVKYFRNRLSDNDQAVTKARLRQFNMKPVSSVRFEYDPFNPLSSSVRQLCRVLHTPRWRASNLDCPCQVSVRGDRCDPTVRLAFNDGQLLVIKTAGFSLADLVEIIQKQTELHTTNEAASAAGQ